MQKCQKSLCYMGFSVFSEVAPSLLIFQYRHFICLRSDGKKKKQMPRVTATGICERTDCKKVMTEFCKTTPEHAASWYHANHFAFCFSVRVFWQEDSKHCVGFSFFTSCRRYRHEKFLGVFYCGPFCKTVRFSLLVISAAIQKERKDRGSVLSGLVYHLLSMRFNSSPRRSRSSTRCRYKEYGLIFAPPVVASVM